MRLPKVPVGFVPKFYTLLRQGIPGKQVSTDIMSGIGVGFVALPLAIAFAIASGVSPDKGLITAIIAGTIISGFGGSRVQIGGPTGAFIVIVYGIVQEHGVDGLTIATFMAGFLIVIMGLLRLGNLLKFIPHPLIVGFTTGIALIILSGQVRDFFGLNMQSVPAGFIPAWTAYFRHFTEVNFYALGVGLVTVLITFHFHRISKKVPGGIVALLLCTVCVQMFDLPVETIGSRFGNIPNHFPAPHLPSIDLHILRELLQPALAIALLGGIESLLSAVVADGMIGSRHRSNAELVAQGTANIFSAVFGGIPATGAIARTATNIRYGGRTPIAGIVHAFVLFLIMLFFAPYAKMIPMATLAGILIVVAYHMSEWRHFRSMLRGNRMDVIVLLTTFFLTVIFDLIVAIEVGIVLSSLLFMKRMSEVVSVETIASETNPPDEKEILFDEEIRNIPKDLILYEINGPLFFGAAQGFQDALSNIHAKPGVIILRMRNVPFVDATGIHRLREVIRDFDNKDVPVVLSGVIDRVRTDLEKGGLFDRFDRARVHTNISDAIAHAKILLEEKRK